ncbi:hypothetical protein N0M98_17160 [Paenibacillus doosanensis]|uniref:Uncharacterized protein n=1 Tax=Paenibacillus konkukensis TaxID=2020716 RepID=A0ABY4RYQ5_9BACL|nr:MULTISPECIES: hypothetical protein [Paenibacillus]MCS7461868.1 hypothetical protein [Paenibacillus doosanensis]UQZ87363.1 hypothetical protein SK3146_06660 [Paenibacillus konkukensis]
MSLRPVELQIALHKNDEAGARQHHMNHKPQQDQTMLAAEAVKQAEKERQTTGVSEQIHHASVKDKPRDKQGGSGGKHAGKRSAAEAGPSAERGEHPFKGKHIDLSL